MRKKLAILLNIAVVGIFVWYVSQNTDDFKQLGNVHVVLLPLVLLLHLAGIIASGLFIRASIKVFGTRITFADSFTSAVISTMGNFFMPAGTGASLRAIFLKKKYGFEYTKFMSSLYANYILVFLINSLIGLLALIGLGDKADNTQYKLIFIILFSTFVASILFMSKKVNRYIIKFTNRSFIPTKIRGFIANSVDGWRLMVSSKEIIEIALLILLAAVLQIVLLYILALSLSISTNILGVILLSALGSISLILNITPGSIGVREAVFAFAAFAMNISVTEAILISLIERVTRFLIIIVAWILTKKFTQTLLASLKR